MAAGRDLAPSIAFRPLQTGAAQACAAIEHWLESERDQLALWLPVALGSGIAAWFLLPDPAAWRAFIAAALALAALGLALDPGGRLRRVLAIGGIVAALGCGLVWARAELVAAPRLARAQVASFSARIEQVEQLATRDALRLTLAPLAASDLPPRVRVNVAVDTAPPGLDPGATIRLRARLLPPPGPGLPGAYDFSQIAWFAQIGAIGRSLDPVVIVAPPVRRDAGTWLAAQRARLSAHILSRLAGGEGAIATAFVSGDQGAISQEDADAMRRSGLAHLLSISGLHVAAVVGAAMFLTLRLLALSPRLALNAPLLLIAACAGALAGIGYTMLSGAQVPTVRSCVAAMVVLLGVALGREAMTLRLVAAGALVILLIRPEALAGPSFQLSFAAVTAIVALHDSTWGKGLFARREEGRGMRLLRELGTLLLTGVAVEAALAPIAVYHFHRAGLYGALANIVAIPLTTFVIMPLEAGALLLDLVGLGAPLWWLTGKALGLLLALAHHVAALPGAIVALPSMPAGAFGLLVGGGLWFCLWRSHGRALGLLPAAIGAAWALATPPPDLLVTGDGKHLALRDGRGVAMLRPRAGDYTRAMLAENAGVDGEPGLLDSLPAAHCGPDVCAVTLARGGRQWHIMATRSADLVPIDRFAQACAGADIVVSDRRLPRSCRPRWLKLDRPALARSGGVAIRLAAAEVVSVADQSGRHPWALGNPLPSRERVCRAHAYRRSNPASLPCTRTWVGA